MRGSHYERPFLAHDSVYANRTAISAFSQFLSSLVPLVNCVCTERVMP